MTEASSRPSSSEHQDSDQNSAVQTTETNHNPNSVLEKGRNAAAGEGPNSAGSGASSTAEEHVPSVHSPESSDLPSAR